MPSRPSLALTGPLLLALPLVGWGSGCTSDLPAPTNFVVLEPPPPANELVVDCAMLPLTAEGARYSQTPTITGQLEDATYRYTATDLPEGLVLDEDTGTISGTVTAMAGDFTFDVTIEDVDDPDAYNATGTCNLHVNEHITTALAIDTAPYCLRPGQSLLSLVVENTGDGTAITCDYTGGSGNGRKPNGVEVDPSECSVTGNIAEDRYGTWAFVMRGVQSGAEVFVPYCVTNDEPQGYEIVGRHSGNDDAALEPITRVYDPQASFTVGEDMDPHYEITSPGVCGTSCFYKYGFLRTNAPIGDGGFSLDPDGLVQDDAMQSIGFFHELRVSGPPVPAEFLERPWVLSAAVSYCISGTDTCVDPAVDGDAALELSLIMVPEGG
jgi:hypothetical protein